MSVKKVENRDNEKPLEGKLAFITGAYQGLGPVTAKALARKGASIVLNDLAGADVEKQGERIVAELAAMGTAVERISGDISRFDELQRMRAWIEDTCGTVDIVVNNAGPFDTSPFLQLEESKWDLVMDVNLKAVYLIARVFAPHMKRRGWGRIVTMSAGSAYNRNHGVYGLAKSAVSFLTEELALELGPEITVNSVAPGQIEESLPLIHKIDPTFGARYTQKAALKRLVTRDDIAGVIAEICCPPFDMMTGETLRVDGGAELPRF